MARLKRGPVTLKVADDKVDRYVAEGWEVEGDKPKAAPKKTAAKSTAKTNTAE